VSSSLATAFWKTMSLSLFSPLRQLSGDNGIQAWFLPTPNTQETILHIIKFKNIFERKENIFILLYILSINKALETSEKVILTNT
jgi:hypothetical protein